MLEFLFPATPAPAGPFPKNPNAPLLNPLREQQKVNAELKAWDDWAVERAVHVSDPPKDPLYPAQTEKQLLNGSAVKEYAPELLSRYQNDPAFRKDVDLRLQYTNDLAALDYYKGLAEAHKAAILAYQAELEKLAAAGKIDKLTPLEEQYRLHPERQQLVQAAWQRVSAGEQAAEEKARQRGLANVDKEYRSIFQLIRGEAAQQQ